MYLHVVDLKEWKLILIAVYLLIIIIAHKIIAL